jgi:hypothetical protein
MTVREMVSVRKVEMLGDLMPARARAILVEFTALYGNCLAESREADFDYAKKLLEILDEGGPANRARIRAETTPEYQRKREADDTTNLVLESMRSLKKMLESIDTEMRLAK